MERVPSVGGNGHESIHQVWLRAGLSEKDWDGLFKWAFVRDPLARFCSVHRAFSQQAKEILVPESIDTWVDWLTDHLAVTYRYMHLIPQTAFIYRPDGKLGVDFLGRVENIQEDWSFVCKRVGVSFELPRLNSTTLEGWKPPSERSKAKIRWLYRLDYELLGYSMQTDPEYLI